VTIAREAYNECNMLNPDTEDSQDEDGELFTQEYFERMEKGQIV
jgi:hypothetical protein